MKLSIDCLEPKAKKLLKQRSDVPFEKEIETIDRLPKTQWQKIVENTDKFLIEKKD